MATTTSSIPLAATLAASSQSEPHTLSVPTLRRSTVLPRIEFDGDRPTLVRDQRERYEAVSRLGEGGMGEVVKVKDNDIGRLVALKRLHPEANNAPTLVRFVEEIRVVGELEHPNIVPIHDVGIDDNGDYFFVMKYVPGEALETVIEKLAAGDVECHAKYPFERRVAIFEALLEAVRYAHANGVIHRDIKPANVMVGPYGEVMLMDWGIAKRTRQQRPDQVVENPREVPTGRDLFSTRAGSLLGTPAYMSPEQARGESIDERSDVYSLCVLFHELCCLRHYLTEKTTLQAMLDGVIHDAAPLAGGVKSAHQGPTPMDLTWYIKKGLAKDPRDRYQTIGEMIERLAKRRQGIIPIQCHITFVKRMTGEWQRFVDRHPILITAAMVLTLVGTILLGALSAR